MYYLIGGGRRGIASLRDASREVGLSLAAQLDGHLACNWDLFY